MSIFREVKVSTLHKWRVKLTDIFSEIYPTEKHDLQRTTSDKLQELIDEVCETIGDKEMQEFGYGPY
jgi:hypothetical protein